VTSCFSRFPIDSARYLALLVYTIFKLKNKPQDWQLTTSSFSIFSLTVGSKDNFLDFGVLLFLDEALEVTLVNGSDAVLMVD
jgi:hypothetical protein